MREPRPPAGPVCHRLLGLSEPAPTFLPDGVIFFVHAGPHENRVDRMSRPPAEPLTDRVVTVPANEAPWDDLQSVFGARGEAASCQCQRYKLERREAFSRFPVEERAERLREQANCGQPEAASTSGLVAYLDGEPVGWCAVEPRPAYSGLLRVYRVPWEGRSEDKSDASVWAVTCVFTRAGYRRRGISYALVRGAVEFARRRGARALEGYPMVTEAGKTVIWSEMHVGSRSIFADAGFTEVGRPTVRRAVMRIDFAQSSPSDARS